jgi:hypothetical protein
MLQIKRLLLITLSILLMSAGFKIPASAFFTCKEIKCIKNKSSFETNRRIAITNPSDNDNSLGSVSGDDEDGGSSGDDGDGSSSGDNGDGSSSGDDGDGGSSGDDGDGSSTGDDGDGGSSGDKTAPGDGAGSGGTSDDDKCATNLNIFAIAKAFLACQISSAISKGKAVIGVYTGLHRRIKRLLRFMKRAPVCTNNGYTIDEFEADHSILANIKAMKKIIKAMEALLEDLNDIKFDCENCKDDDALNAALAALDTIGARLANLITDFTGQMTNINNRFNNFINRLRVVAGLHSTSPSEIMIECNVSFKVARRMANARRRVIREINKLIDYKRRVNDKIRDIGFGSHDCVKADLEGPQAAVACIDA